MQAPYSRILVALAVSAVLPTVGAAQSAASTGAAVKCAPDNGGITLPAGFCATIFADSLPGPRHVVVAPNGDVFVALRGARVPDSTAQGGFRAVPGGFIGLRDTDRDGRADMREKGGSFAATEVALFDGHLYTENGGAVLRYRLARGSLRADDAPDTIVSGLPTGGHGAKSFAIGRDGALYVNIGSRTNSCQVADRQKASPGVDPCVELETRAGIWRFDARKVGQTQSSGERFATGIRNAVAITVNPADGALYVMQHGRDNLADNWPELYNAQQSAESPAEEMFRVTRGSDFGWPYCYYDTVRRARLLAPEYGGDGKTVGRCASTRPHVAAFPGHWAPNALLFYTGSSFPARYRQGAFIAFHGSWNRFPLPQGGYNVVFQPMRGGRAAGDYEVFARDFAANLATQRSQGNHRPAGLAQGPDGALYVTDDARGRIWKITYAR